jgi:WhiB family redox-sensing transcriptional regulator
MADFRLQAACRDVDPELFFPLGSGPQAWNQVRLAKSVCDRCPVREPCLDWALSTGQREGVWGGQDPDQRRAHRQEVHCSGTSPAGERDQPQQVSPRRLPSGSRT